MPGRMPQEIERKYLVTSDAWRGLGPGTRMRQGYLSTDEQRVVRVRLAGDRAWLTIKGMTTRATRREYEYEIPVLHAEELLDSLCLRPIIEKTRYAIPFDRHVIEVDEFHGVNEGLLIAEIEVASEQTKPSLPHWIGKDVTQLARYSNAVLQTRPFADWSEPERRGE
jgi:adenylate cyclase